MFFPPEWVVRNNVTNSNWEGKLKFHHCASTIINLIYKQQHWGCSICVSSGWMPLTWRNQKNIVKKEVSHAATWLTILGPLFLSLHALVTLDSEQKLLTPLHSRAMAVLRYPFFIIALYPRLCKLPEKDSDFLGYIAVASAWQEGFPR